MPRGGGALYTWVTTHKRLENREKATYGENREKGSLQCLVETRNLSKQFSEKGKTSESSGVTKGRDTLDFPLPVGWDGDSKIFKYI